MSFLKTARINHISDLVEYDAIDVAREFGLDVEHLIYDGEIQRVKTFSHPKNLNGWYIADPSGKSLVVGDWQTGLKKVWHQNQYQNNYKNRHVLSQEKLKFKQVVEQNKAKRVNEQRIAGENAAKLFSSSKQVVTHPYLESKNINLVDGLRVNSGNLLIPLFNIDEQSGRILNIQKIYRNGNKCFLKGGQVTGLCFPLGNLKLDIDIVYIAEGFSTAATVHLITDDLVLAAMNAGNLQSVAISARKRWPTAKIVIAGDDDWSTENKTGVNPGIDKATEAAIAVGGFTSFPPFSDEQRKQNLTDWNDYLYAYPSENV